MNSNVIIETIDLKDGRQITIETGRLARQADGSVVVRMGNTMLLATVVANEKASEGIDFLPLTVDYREKFASSGRFPGGFLKREARPSNEEILTMRLVDRVLRPLFPKDYHCEVQVMIQLMSYDENAAPDALAALAASAALSLTDIPFDGPISETRVARINGEYVINPSYEELKQADLDLMVGASSSSVIMVEGEMKEVSEEQMIEAISIAHRAVKEQCEVQLSLREKVGINKIREYEKQRQDESIAEKIHQFAYDKIYSIAKDGSSKKERTEKFELIKQEVEALFTEQEIEEDGSLINKYYKETNKKAIRGLALKEGLRLDGRKATDIRPIWTAVDYLPSTHGSAIFTRGETQALATTTLGGTREVNVIDLATRQGEERFYLHYNFPPFSTGEARPLRGTSRREIGHGNLAQRSLKAMIPEDCPYTVRVVSEILESNGSSSMATVCAGTLSLLDAGIQLKKSVSGIAMGLILDEQTDEFVILSDILGDEDHLGDMDFKVTGTADGLTACQMDIKIKGLSYEVLGKALMQARQGRLHILNKLNEALDKPRTQVKAHAPKIVKMEIAKDFIGAVIGPGGKIIQEIQQQTSTTIAIEEVDDLGLVEILGTDQAGIDKAIATIKEITFTPEVGQVYTAEVVSIKDFGAFVSLAKGVEGLVHISELRWERVNKVEDILKLGDKIDVKFMGYDKGKMRLSHKTLLARPKRKSHVGDNTD